MSALALTTDFRGHCTPADENIRIVVVCQECGRFRIARQWVAERPECEHKEIHDYCTDCYEKILKSLGESCTNVPPRPWQLAGL